MTGGLLLTIALPVLGLIVLANFGERYEVPRTLTFVFLALLAGTLLLTTAFSTLALAFRPLAGFSEGGTVAPTLFLNLAGAALATAVLLLPVRRFLARVLPIRAESPVHATALVLAVLVGANGLAVVASPNFLSDLAKSSAALTPSTLIIQGAAFVAAALAGVGLWTRRTWRETRLRLGLTFPTLTGLIAALLLVPLFFGASCAADKASQVVTPGTSQAIDAIVRQLFRAFASPGGALLLGVVAGISEELLFRGALVPRLGLLLSALLFASLHSEYGLSLQTADVFLLGLVLGILRQRAGTTASIIAHAGYDTAIGLLALTNINILGCT